MMNEASPAVVTAQHGADNLAFLQGYKAEAWIASQEGCKGLGFVGFAEADAFCSLPKRSGLRNVRRLKRYNGGGDAVHDG